MWGFPGICVPHGQHMTQGLCLSAGGWVSDWVDPAGIFNILVTLETFNIDKSVAVEKP